MKTQQPLPDPAADVHQGRSAAPRRARQRPGGPDRRPAPGIIFPILFPAPGLMMLEAWPELHADLVYRRRSGFLAVQGWLLFNRQQTIANGCWA